jgi:hypothetical protein
VQGAARETAARQCPIDRRDTEGQDPMRRRHRPLDLPDALAELKKKGFLRNHVPFLFLVSLIVKVTLALGPRQPRREAARRFGNLIGPAGKR